MYLNLAPSELDPFSKLGQYHHNAQHKALVQHHPFLADLESLYYPEGDKQAPYRHEVPSGQEAFLRNDDKK